MKSNYNDATTYFDHKKLNIYQKSLEFIERLEIVLSEKPKGISILKQLDRATVSIPLNIVEGNRKYTSADRYNFFDIARGSALECAASLDVLVDQGIRKHSEIKEGKERYFGQSSLHSSAK